MFKLQLGCGGYRPEDYLNLDISELWTPDIVWDIRKGFPFFRDSQFEEVLSRGCLEELNNEEFRDTLNEIWRILKSDGVLVGTLTSSHPDVLFSDPMCKLYFQRDSFDYFDVSKYAWQNMGKQYKFKGWNILECEMDENKIFKFKMTPHGKS